MIPIEFCTGICNFSQRWNDPVAGVAGRATIRVLVAGDFLKEPSDDALSAERTDLTARMRLSRDRGKSRSKSRC
jgi:hypothetical protein